MPDWDIRQVDMPKGSSPTWLRGFWPGRAVCMLETLRAELQAIQKWPCGECPTETEKQAVANRAFRAIELENQIAALIARN